MTIESRPGKAIQESQSGALAQDAGDGPDRTVTGFARQDRASARQDRASARQDYAPALHARESARHVRESLSREFGQDTGNNGKHTGKTASDMMQETGNALPSSAIAACAQVPGSITEISENTENTENPEISDQVADLNPGGFGTRIECNFDENSRIPNNDIPDIVRHSTCSIRLLNVIMKYSNDLPMTTVQDYMKAPGQSRKAFLGLQGLGSVLMDELDEIMHDFAMSIPAFENERLAILEKNAKVQRAIRAIEVFFTGVWYPDELFEWSPSTRLVNQLKVDRSKHRKAFVDFLRTCNETGSRLLSQWGCGIKSIRELDEIVLRLIEARLSVCNADVALAPDLAFLLNGETISEASLAGVIELENTRPEKIEAFEAALLEKKTIAEIIAESIVSRGEKQQAILKQRYGIGYSERQKVVQIANTHGVTPEYIRQVERNAKHGLRTKRMIKTLVAALKREGTLGKLFRDRKVFSRKRMNLAKTLLTPEEYLAIDLAYGNLESFLDTEAITIRAGWIHDHDPVLVKHETEDMSDTLGQRIISAIRKQHLPIRLSLIASAVPDYSMSEVRDMLSRRFGATFDDDLVESCPRVSLVIQCILVLREAGHAMHCNEIKARIHEVFGNNETIHYIGSILADLKEALIVGPGTYDLYENSGLSKQDFEEIRVRAFDYLKSVDGFMQSSALFFALFRKDSGQFGTAFGSHMLYSILRDDGRFRVRRRMQVGISVLSNDDNSNS